MDGASDSSNGALGHDNYGYYLDAQDSRDDRRGPAPPDIPEAPPIGFTSADLPDDNFKGHDTDSEMTQSKGSQDTAGTDIMYKVDDIPPWYGSIFLGIQHFLTMIGSTISIPYILTPLLCIDDGDPARGKLVCTIIFVSGLVTLLQTTLGIRLPIIQGGTFSFLVPTLAIIKTNFEPCDFASHENMTASELEEEWQVRIREIQGAIAVSSIVQVVIGFSGVIGFLLVWITPLTIVPTVTLVGLSLFSTAAEKAAFHWGISLATIVLLVMFSQYLKEIPVPIPYYKKGSGWTFTWFYFFKLFPVLLAILISWALCAILTAGGAFPPGNRARTDLNTEVIYKSPWFRVPYPGQWGLPTVSLAGTLGMLAGVLASMLESVGDYYACARIAGAPPPPVHAINRGIGIEGIGCILAGLWGSGNGTTSYSENIGAIGVTKVGSRRVVQVAAIIMMLFGVIGKFGAAMVTIPEPIVGGMFIVMFSMITAVGLSTLQFVNLSSARNLFVLGFSIFFGLALPKWVYSHSDSIQTGNETLNQILSVLLQTSMLVGGVLGFILDNTIPGTPEERGIVQWNAQTTTASGDQSCPQCYDLPYITEMVKRIKWTKYVPFCPTFAGYGRRKPKDIEARAG